MKSEILSVGTELLLGQLVDTNAPFLAQSLSTLGIDVFWISQVGDNQDRLVQALRRGLERSDLIVISGGMGPTGDDLTREAISELLGETMEVHLDLEKELRAFFARRGRAMPERNVKQATLIPSATAIPNPIGTAPGWWVERDGRIIVGMPGVPVEMKRMWEEEVVPRLARVAGSGVIFSRNVKVIGMGESWVEDEVRVLTESANPTVATYAKQDGVHVRVTAKAESLKTARQMVDETEARIRAILGDHIYGVDDYTLADAVGALLDQTGLTLAVLEMGTAGQLAASLAASVGVKERLAGSLVAADTQMLLRLGMSAGVLSAHGVLSREAVEAMASAARAFSTADVGLSVVCGMEDETGGGQTLGIVHCAVDLHGTVTSTTMRYTTTEREVRRRALLDATDLLRRQLLLRQTMAKTKKEE